MVERRQHARGRTYLGGAIALANRRSILSCIVRDLTAEGARLEFDLTGIIPEGFDLTIRGRSGPMWASVIWRSRDCVGVSLAPSRERPEELTRRMRAAERERTLLRRRVAQVAEGY